MRFIITAGPGDSDTTSDADALADEPSLADYHLLKAVPADFLAKLGRFDEARRELERAAPLTQNTRERTLLLERARSLPPGR